MPVLHLLHLLHLLQRGGISNADSFGLRSTQGCRSTVAWQRPESDRIQSSEVPMDVQPISALKATMPAVLRAMRENRRPVMVVSKGKPQAVLQDVASYESTQDAIALLKMMVQSERSVASNHGSSTKAVLARLRNRVKAQAEAGAS